MGKIKSDKSNNNFIRSVNIILIGVTAMLLLLLTISQLGFLDKKNIYQIQVADILQNQEVQIFHNDKDITDEVVVSDSKKDIDIKLNEKVEGSYSFAWNKNEGNNNSVYKIILTIDELTLKKSFRVMQLQDDIYKRLEHKIKNGQVIISTNSLQDIKIVTYKDITIVVMIPMTILLIIQIRTYFIKYNEE